MGYDTNFEGSFKLNKQLSLDDARWLIEWSEERHEDLNDSTDGHYSYYCQWVPNKNGTAIEWDGTEKFSQYIEWLQYLIDEFFEPNGYVLNGEVEWDGEEQGDMGIINVKNNKITTKKARLVYDR